MNGLPLPASIKRPGVMSTAELATWAPVGRSAVSQIVSHRDIPGLSGNAKNYFTTNSYMWRTSKIRLEFSCREATFFSIDKRRDVWLTAATNTKNDSLEVFA